MRPLYFALAIVAACGHDSNTTMPDAGRGVDAPRADAAASADASPDAPAVGLVSASVIQNGVPQVGVHVLFNNADSSLVADIMTDANGSASQQMAAGGFVTAIGPFPLASTADMYTVADVQPGDQLVFAQTVPVTGGGSVSVTTALVPNAATYLMNSPCAGGSLTPLSDRAIGGLVTSGCTTTGFIIVAADGSGAPLASLYDPSLTVPFGSAFTLDLTAEAYEPAQTATYTVAHVPGTSVTVAYGVYSAQGFLGSTGTFGPLSAGSASLTLQHLSAAGLTGAVTTSYATNLGGFRITDWLDGGSDYTLDAAALQLPGFETTAVYDLFRQTITWTPRGGTAAPDLVRAQVSFTGDDNFHWRIVAPYTGGSITFPVLAGHTPALDDRFTLNDLEVVQVTGGWNAYRARLVATPTLSASPYLTSTPGRLIIAE